MKLLYVVLIGHLPAVVLTCLNGLPSVLWHSSRIHQLEYIQN